MQRVSKKVWSVILSFTLFTFIHPLIIFPTFGLGKQALGQLSKSSLATIVRSSGKLNLAVTNATYYVSPSGNDFSAGTLSQPWKTINRALTGRSAGDIIFLEAGATFTENIKVASSGAQDLPVIVKSDPTNPATIRQANSSQSAIYIYNKGYLTFENILIIGVGRSLTLKMGVEAYADNGMYSGLTFNNVSVSEFYRGFQFIGYGGGSSFGFSGITLENCEGSYNLDAGALTWGQAAGAIRNVVVRNSRFNYNFGDPNSTKNSGNGFSAGSIWDGLFERIITHDNGGQGNAVAGPVGIMVYDSKRVTIQFSESYNNKAKYQDGDGFDLDLGTSDSIIQYCYSHNNYGAGILLSTDGNLASWTNNIVRYNISENDGWGGKMGGLHLYSPGTIAPLKNSQIYNNTIYSNISPAVWFYDFANMSGVKLWNNIFATANGHALVKTEITPSPTIGQAQFQGNAYWTYGGTFNVAGYTSLYAWGSGKGQELLNTTQVGLNVNPLFVNAGGGGTIGDPRFLNTLSAYRLQSVSPLINAGLDLRATFGINSVGPIDFYSTPLPQGGAYDSGAAEFSGTTVPTPPLAPSALSITSITSSAVGLAWTDNANNEDGFEVQRSMDGINFVRQSSVGSNTSVYTDTGLQTGVKFYYRVNAYNVSGSSDFSSVVSGTTQDASVPIAPSNLMASPTTQKGRIALKWDASIGASSYNVKRSTTSTGPYSIIATGVTSTNYLSTGLRSRMTYYYVVTAVNANGESSNSNVASATAK